MKIKSVIFILLLLGGCSVERVEEFAFRKSMEYQLKDDCGEDNKECIQAVEEQIDLCMKKSNWRKYLENDKDEAELNRFISAFFPCFKDANGNSYFG